MFNKLPVCQQKVRSLKFDMDSIVSFGHYYQEDSELQFGYDVEWLPIKEKNSAVLLVSKEALYCKTLGSKGLTSWEESSLRKWLNSTWIEKSFTKYGDGPALVPVPSDNPMNVPNLVPYSKPAEGEIRKRKANEDYVFLLSAAEVNDIFYKDECRLIPHWLADDTVIDTPHTVKWWTRPDIDTGENCINEDGFSETIDADSEGIFVRPALWIDNFYAKRCVLDVLSAWENLVEDANNNKFDYEKFKCAASEAYKLLYLYSSSAETVVTYPKIVVKAIILITQFSMIALDEENKHHLLTVNAAASLADQSINWKRIYKNNPKPGEPGAMKYGFLTRGLNGETIVVDALTFDLENPIDTKKLIDDGFYAM